MTPEPASAPPRGFEPWFDSPEVPHPSILPHDIEREGLFIVDYTDEIVIEAPKPGLIQ